MQRKQDIQSDLILKDGDRKKKSLYLSHNHIPSLKKNLEKKSQNIPLELLLV